MRILCVILLFTTMFLGVDNCPAVDGWLSWRGPGQMGVSSETNLPSRIVLDGENYLWSISLAGKGTPIIAGNRVYAWGYRGEGPNLQEVLVCLDSETGKTIWERGFNDFISDIIYNRYAIGSVTVDSENGIIYAYTSPGLLLALNQEGEILWQHSLMEEFGRLTFPNGRTGSPVIDGNLVIVHGITTNWGKQGPARDRFYAFNKLSGKLVWASTPGVAPTDSSFSTPVFTWLGDQRVFYCGTGCGNVVCVNARTGKPLMRFQFLHGGINSSVLLTEDNRVIAIHGKENLDSSEIGRMAAIRMDTPPKADESGPIVLGPEYELWRNRLGIFTSSPVLVGNRVYQTTHTGDLACVDAKSGNILWEKKLANSQLHASPLYADGKLYIPMVDGALHILKPDDNGAETLCRIQLEGSCLGAPAVWNRRIYIHTSERLYCFGASKKTSVTSASTTMEIQPRPSSLATQILAIPAEVLLKPGESQSIELLPVDANGNAVSSVDLSQKNWSKFIPGGAKVRSELDAVVDNNNVITASLKNTVSAGMFKVTSGILLALYEVEFYQKSHLRRTLKDLNLVLPIHKRKVYNSRTHRYHGLVLALNGKFAR